MDEKAYKQAAKLLHLTKLTLDSVELEETSNGIKPKAPTTRQKCFEALYSMKEMFGCFKFKVE